MFYSFFVGLSCQFYTIKKSGHANVHEQVERISSNHRFFIFSCEIHFLSPDVAVVCESRLLQ
jgi:hypothetical protein